MPATIYTDSPLGRKVEEPSHYDPALLYPIARAETRSGMEVPAADYGGDIWNAYELSWLDAHGKPVVAMGRFTFPADSPNLIESKSFKLYLNSYNDERFELADIVRQRMQLDLTRAGGKPVLVEILPLRPAYELSCQAMAGICIDDQDIDIQTYDPAPALLHTSDPASIVHETLVSELLKTNCPVTGQPDWASLQIQYEGPQIDRSALLAYIVSLRHHNEFHELCVEKIYGEIMARCEPASLFVYARYTRRGGLDINPWRANHQPKRISQARTLRQ
ncbi:MAG: NADPH-dependent 7-cyano-7-deazaguanine reductase QueF [Alcaligenaceae bacterium]|nr:NADPH-dependent 7-cyano-7-deazaguanine reductase QueF [Alcaligenaceae bacterium]